MWVRTILAVVSVVSLAWPCSGSGADLPDVPALPGTPAGSRLAQWLQVVNEGNAQSARRFVEGHYDRTNLSKEGIDRQVSTLVRTHRNHGTLQIRRIEKSTDHLVKVLIRSDLSETWMQITVRVADRPPNPIAGLRMIPADAEGDRPILGDGEIARQLDEYLHKLTAADQFSGAVLVARGGRPFFQKAYGLASKEYQAANRTDTKFNIASMGKMFTAVAVLQLAGQGKLSLQDPVGKYLPDYPNADVARKVTLHQLLTHTSGLGDYFNEKFAAKPKDQLRSISDFFPLFINQPLDFEPGKQFQYSNAGYVLLGAVIEKLSGERYEDYVRSHIYEPAGMTNTGSFETDHVNLNLATGYTYVTPAGAEDRGHWENNFFLHPVKGGPAGGSYSTVEDLLRFDQALRRHHLLSPQGTELIWAGKVDSGRGPENRYAYGFHDARVYGTRVVGHGGDFEGVNSQLDMFLDLGYTTVVLSNYDPPAASSVVHKLRDLLCRK